jgi:hypothetical protein
MYTLDGTNVYALIHNEWHAAPGCDPGYNWVNSITLMTSSNGGLWYAHPANYKIRVPPVPWSSSFPCTPSTGRTVYGSFDPSNIIKSRADGYYYAFFGSFPDPAGLSDLADCEMRTNNLADASSWQVWAQGSWQPALTTPRCSTVPPFSPITGDVFSVNYSTYLGAYIAIVGGQTGANGGSIWYSLSQDLMNWSPLVKLMALPNDQNQYYGSLLDPTDTSTNFENIGQTPYLYLTTYHPADSADRDLVREQIKFTKLTAAPVCTPDPSSPQTQTLACPAGQTGSITQTRTSTCPGPTWSAWTTSANTCVTPPPPPPPPPASCTLNGTIVQDGQSATFYAASSVTSPATCSGVSQSRSCSNGTLSGDPSFQYSSCTLTQSTCTPN